MTRRLAAIAALSLALGGAEALAEPAPTPAGPPPPAEEPVRLARADYRALIERESARAGLPAEIAEAVMAVESGYNPEARGAAGEVGLMQVMPGTARMLGFSGGDAQLADPATNIRLGVTYLAGAWRKAGQDICTATMKYRAGHGETRFSQLSVNYCVAVRSKLQARGYAVTGVVPEATFGFATASAGARGAASGRNRGGVCRGACLQGSGGGTDVAALNRRLESIVFSVKVVSLAKR